MTDSQRRQLLDKLTQMVDEDFGSSNDNGLSDSFCPHCVAHRAIDMLDDVYALEKDVDDIAQRILDERDKGDPDTEKVATVH